MMVHEYVPSRETLVGMLSFKRNNIFEDDQAAVGAVLFFFFFALWVATLTTNWGYFKGRQEKELRKQGDALTWSGDLLMSAFNALNLYLRGGKRHCSSIQGLKSKPPDPPLLICSIQFPMEQIANPSIVTLPQIHTY